MLDDYVAPVCAPNLPLGSDDPLSLLNHPLINYEWSGYSNIDPNWSKWFQSIGMDVEPPMPVATYSDEYMCLQAAINGHGIALVSLIAAARDIEAGRLVAPFPTRLKNMGYYLICPPMNADRA